MDQASWKELKKVRAKFVKVSLGSCVTSIAGPHGAAQLYER
jgi:hypothetical protein